MSTRVMILQVPLDDEGPDKRIFLSDYSWLTTDEIDMKQRYDARINNTVQKSYMPRTMTESRWRDVACTTVYYRL